MYPNPRILLRHASFLLAAAALTGASGCERGPNDQVGAELFRAEAEPRMTDRILLAQAVTGAGEDAMLYGHHFDGVELNSLGMAKLRLMLEDAQFLADPTVYVLSGRAEHMAAVRSYMGEWGGAFAETKLEAGPNPSARRPAAMGMAQQQKLESATMDGGNATSIQTGS